MSYIPNQVQVYTAAYAGTQAGLGIAGRDISTSNAAPGIVKVARVAGAFAQAVDIAWAGAGTPNFLDVQIINTACVGYWAGREPDSENPSDYAEIAFVIILNVQAGDAYFSSQGITPPPVGGGGGSGNATSLQGFPIDPTTPTNHQFLYDNGTEWSPVTLTQDLVLPGFTPTLALASGGAGPFLLGTTWTPAFTVNPAPNAGGISSPLISDNQGHSNVPIVGGNPVASASGGGYTPSVPSTVTTFVTETQNGVTKNTNNVNGTFGNDNFFGVGTAGATGLNGTTGALVGATGTLTAALSTNGDTVFSPAPSNQKVYYASDQAYGTKIFKDANNNPIVMTVGSPLSITVVNGAGASRPFYLYESFNLLSSVANPITPS